MKAQMQTAGFGAVNSRQRGFSLFELLVYLLIASILFAAAANRYREYPAEAERANFVAVLAQLKAGVNLQMMRMIANADWTQAQRERIEGTNPMSLMLETPSNYLGEFEVADTTTMPRRTWYFDTSVGELVYLADNSTNLYLFQDDQPVNADQIRFRLINVYETASDAAPVSSEVESFAEEASANDASHRGRWQGLTLSPVTPYEWRSVPLQPLVANSQ